jgi:tetratricopeptide (TPR) repeat protein
MLEASVKADPRYPLAWAALGRAYTTNASLQFGGVEHYEKARAAYEKALALDPALISPRVYMGNLLTDTGRVEEAVPLLKKALAVNPNYAEAHWELGYAYRFGGLLHESSVEAERARQLDPAVKLHSSAINSYLYLGQYQRFLDSLPVDEASAFITFYRGFGAYLLGNKDLAKEEFDRAYRLDPSLLPVQVGRALSLGMEDRRVQGLAILHETEARMGERGVKDPEAIYKVAEAYAVLGDKESALRLLRRGIEGGFFCYPYFLIDPMMNPIRGEPEFHALMDQARRRHEEFKRANLS